MTFVNTKITRAADENHSPRPRPRDTMTAAPEKAAKPEQGA